MQQKGCEIQRDNETGSPWITLHKYSQSPTYSAQLFISGLWFMYVTNLVYHNNSKHEYKNQTFKKGAQWGKLRKAPLWPPCNNRLFQFHPKSFINLFDSDNAGLYIILATYYKYCWLWMNATVYAVFDLQCVPRCLILLNAGTSLIQDMKIW